MTQPQTTKLSKARSQTLAQAGAWSDPYVYAVDLMPNQVAGLYSEDLGIPRDYKSELKQCRFFYRYDPIASTVINRMSDMSITPIVNRRAMANDEEMAFFNGIAEKLTDLLQACALEYLISGMAIPDYGYRKEMGNRIHPNLGRKRYTVPDPVWVRNPENIILKRNPAQLSRAVYLQIPPDEAQFIKNKGIRTDGTSDVEAYDRLVRQFPAYVRMIQEGRLVIPLPNVRPILRKPMSHMDFPQPFLVPALASLKHKLRIKQMDFSIASRAIEAIRLIKAGDKDFPLVDDDPTLDELRTQLSLRPMNSQQELIYSLFANHTVTIEWVYPPLDALLSDQKYNEPNAEIFMAMGFSRVLLVGETLRSNASQTTTSTLGPVATLIELRRNILEWVKQLYMELAELNGLKNTPVPEFAPIPAADTAALAQFAIEAAKAGALSKNTLARMFGTDFETEHQQIKAESALADTTPLVDLVYEMPVEQQQKQIDNTQEVQREQLRQQQQPQGDTGNDDNDNISSTS